MITLKIKSKSHFPSESANQIQDFSGARAEGNSNAQNILNTLFSNTPYYGNIESHPNTEKLNSSKYTDFKSRLISLYYETHKLDQELESLCASENALINKLRRINRSIFKFILKKKRINLERNLESVKKQRSALENYLTSKPASISYYFEEKEFKSAHSDFVSAFTTLKSSARIWDISFTTENHDTKAAAKTAAQKNIVNFTLKHPENLTSTEKVLYLENYNGGDFYFFPTFILFFKNKDEIAILDYKDTHIRFEEVRFLEKHEDIPGDTKIIGETWYRVNKDGSPDKRFINNFKIPVVLYGSLHIKSTTGINELYYISDVQKARQFYEQYQILQNKLNNVTIIESGDN